LSCRHCAFGAGYPPEHDSVKKGLQITSRVDDQVNVHGRRGRQVRGREQVAAFRHHPQEIDPNAYSLVRVVFEPVVPVACVKPAANVASPANVGRSSSEATWTTLCPGLWPPVGETTDPGAASHCSSK
jgi:hypothetical protein